MYLSICICSCCAEKTVHRGGPRLVSPPMYIQLYIYIYIYIYMERDREERDIDIHMYIYIYIYTYILSIYIYIYIERERYMDRHLYIMYVAYCIFQNLQATPLRRRAARR